MGVVIGGLPRLAVDASEVNVGNPLNMNSNDIINANTITASNNLTLNAGNNNGIIIESSKLVSTEELDLVHFTKMPKAKT